MHRNAFLAFIDRKILTFKEVVNKITQKDAFSGEVDNGPRERLLHFGEVQESTGTLTFDHKATSCVV